MRELSRGICLLQPQDYRRMPWKNGLGMTTELAVSPVGAGLNGRPFDWRVSLAEIETGCEFSLFPGYDRSILLSEGAGMELSFDSAPPQPPPARRSLLLILRGKGNPFSLFWGGPLRD